MYTPHHFKESSREEQLAFIQEHPFGVLVSTHTNLEPIATHLPFLLKCSGENEVYIEGHIASANAHSDILKNGRSALAIFAGSHGYISSSVYQKPDAPTWNYQAVHAYGTIRRLTNEELLLHLEEMVRIHENNRPDAFHLTKIPSEQRSDYFRQILGFTLKIYKLEAAFKLSQNRSEKDFNAIISDLSSAAENESLVKMMKKHRRK